MTERQNPAPERREADRYEIRLTGHLDARWTAWFDGLAVSYGSDGTTVISGHIVDQAALHGLLQRVRDLGLPLVSVRQVEDDQPDTTTPDARERTHTTTEETDMAHNTQASTSKGSAMSTMRKTAFVAGVLYLLTFISSIPAVFLQGPVLNDPNFIIGSADLDTQVRLGALFDIVNSLTAIGTAVALYAVIKRQHQGFAIGFVSSRLFEGAVLMIGVISILSIVTLQQPGATGAEASLLVSTAAHARHRPQLDLRARDRRPRPQRLPARLDHVQVAPRPAGDPGDRAHRRPAVHLLDHRLRPRRHRTRHRLARDSASPRSSSGSCRSACG